MARSPHVPQILQGPLAARPAAASTPDWVWYFAWDDDGGAFHRPTPNGWERATPAVCGPWQSPVLANGWRAATAPVQFRRNGATLELRGGVTRDGGSLPAVVTTLPEGCRPVMPVWLPVVVADGLGIVKIDVDGDLTAFEPVAGAEASTNALLALDGVRVPL